MIVSTSWLYINQDKYAILDINQNPVPKGINKQIGGLRLMG